ncbi:RNA-binding, protein [Novymonas esmeraldas]|uniref:RNA-binding, protein n=1 Tax=Novymonas esmeraldas TaxID=1808958 RepID=A0AAW0ENU2_9TRYP
MDAPARELAACDLQNYQLARQLHILPQLYDVFVSNAACCPLFYDSLPPAARRLARLVLLSLHRSFGARVVPAARRYLLDSLQLIVSFLSFPEHPADREGCRSSLLTVAPSIQSVPNTPKPVTLTSPAGVAASAPAYELPASRTADGAPPGPTSIPPSPASRPATQPAAPAVATAGLPSIMTKPMFFVRPTAVAAATGAAPQFGSTTTHLYVRMVHPHLLNEESLNPFFGRYGQVDVVPLQRTPLQQYVPHVGDAVAAALQHLFPSAEVGDTIYVQDFIIAVDSHQNALQALRRAYYKELVCIALHDTTVDCGGGSSSNNTHCVADVDRWMRHHPFVWRMRADPRSVAKEKAAAAAAAAVASEEDAAAAAAHQRRKRARARKRRHARRVKRRSVLGIAAGDTSTSSTDEDGSDKDGATTTGAGDTRHRGARSNRSSSSSSSSSISGSSSSSSSSTGSDGDAGGDGLAGFVPDVLLDGFPYWTTEDQLKVLLQEHGTVVELRLSVDDLTGAFAGCVLVRMSTAAEALALSRALHNFHYRGFPLLSGVVNERLAVVALEDGAEVRLPSPPEHAMFNVALHDRVWV